MNLLKIISMIQHRAQILHTVAENPENIELIDKGRLAAKVYVATDGAQQKRGNVSKIGAVFEILIDTRDKYARKYARKSKVNFNILSTIRLKTRV